MAIPKRNAFPRIGTSAARNFFESYARIVTFLNWLLHMAGSIDAIVKESHTALQETEHDEEKKAKREEEWKSRKGKGMVDELKRNRQFLLEILLTRHIENYLNYLSELLSEIFRQRPETLKSSERVEMAEVLRHDTLESFVREAAERKVESLSYASYSDLSLFFSERFGLTLFPDSDVPTVIEAIETRNIAVHNRCYINDRFCNRTGADRALMGKQKALDIDEIDNLRPVLFRSVKTLDKQARKKLKLKGSRFKIAPR